MSSSAGAFAWRARALLTTSKAILIPKRSQAGSTFQPRRVQDVADGRVELREHSKHIRSRHT